MKLSRSLRKKNNEPFAERLIGKYLLISASVSILTIIAILGTFLYQSVNFFGHVSFIEFITETRWTPLFKPPYFGVAPLISGTLLVALISLIVSVPLGLCIAIFLSEYASDRLRKFIKPILEILAGIPTVVYGYFAITYVTPKLKIMFPDLIIFNALSAGLVMGLMIIPMISSLSEDAMISVPRLLREGAYALGARKFEVAIRIVIPASISGIITSIILAMSRAIGETMIVSIAAGSTPKLTLNPLNSIQTMTAYINQISLGEASFYSIQYQTIFAVGTTLFLLVFILNTFGYWITKKYQRRY